MSSPKKVLVIDCGASHVAVGFFTVAPKDVTLTAFETEAIGNDYATDQEWINAVQMGLRAISKRRKLSGPAYLIAPGHLLLMKFLKIPHVAKNKRDQIVKFEAQQNIPYPLPEVVWDYETLLDDGAEFEVALVAIKIEIVQSLCDQLARLGLEAEVVEPSGMAQFNAFTRSYPEVQNGALLVSIGAKSTDLLFIDTHGFFIRNVPIAGNTLTQGISDDLKISFAHAEALKIHVFGGESADVEEEMLHGVQRATESFLRRFSMEVTRSIVNFRRQSGAEQVSNVYLTGGGAIVPGIIENLSEKLKLEVEWYDALRNVTVHRKVAEEVLDSHRLQLSSLVGTAMRGSSNARSHFNLLPPALAKQIEFKHKRTYLVGAAALLVVAGFIPILNYQNQADTFVQQAEMLEAELLPLRDFNRKVRRNLQRADEIGQRIESFQQLTISKGNWIALLRDLQDSLVRVEDVWLDELSVIAPAQQAQPAARAGMFGEQPQAQQAPQQLRLNVSGRLLDRENPLSRVSPASRERVTNLLASFTNSDFVSAVENERFDAEEPGILRFNFNLVVAPERGL
jgi:type IV pilus assembly protein PilM